MILNGLSDLIKLYGFSIFFSLCDVAICQDSVEVNPESTTHMANAQDEKILTE